MEKQVTLTIVQGLCFALIETRFCPLQPSNHPIQPGTQSKTLTHIWLLMVPAPWLTPEKQSGSQQSKGVRSPICQNWEYVSVFSYAEKSFSLIATENGEPPFGGTALAAGPDVKGRGRNGGREGAREECKL